MYAIRSYYGVEMSPILAELDKKVSDADPYIKGLRAALNRPGVVRVVIDLKAEVVPQVFTRNNFV